MSMLTLLTALAVHAQDNSEASLKAAGDLFNQGNVDQAVDIWKKLSSNSIDYEVTDSVKMISLMKLAQSYLLDYNNLDTTNFYLNQLQDHCEKYGENRCFVYKFGLESLYHEFNNEFIAAIQSSKKGIDYVNKGGCEDLWNATYSNYGYNFFQIGELEKAREQYLIASKSKQSNDFQKLESTINISSTFENEPDSVLLYSRPGLALCDSLQDIIGQIS